MFSPKPPLHSPPPTGVTGLVSVGQAQGAGLCLLPSSTCDRSCLACGELDDAVGGKEVPTEQQGSEL